MAKLFPRVLLGAIWVLFNTANAQDRTSSISSEVSAGRSQYQQAYAALRDADANLEGDLRSRPSAEMLTRIDRVHQLRTNVLQTQAKYYRALRGDFQEHFAKITAELTQPGIQNTRQALQNEIDSLAATDRNLEKEMQALQSGDAVLKQAIQSERDANRRLKNVLERQRVELDGVNQASQGSETALSSFSFNQKAVIAILEEEEARVSGPQTRAWNSYYEALRKAVREPGTVLSSAVTQVTPPAPKDPVSWFVGEWQFAGGPTNFMGTEPTTVKLKITQAGALLYGFYQGKFRAAGADKSVDISFRFHDMEGQDSLESSWSTPYNGAHGKIRLVRYRSNDTLEISLEDSTTGEVPNTAQLLRRQ